MAANCTQDDCFRSRGRSRTTTKIPRYSTRWENSLYEKCSRKSMSLEKLFDAKQWQGRSSAKRRPYQKKSYGKQSTCLQRNRGEKQTEKSLPVKLWLEHREGGALATHADEERILLFRSDRPGAIAKVIFSSRQTAENLTEEGVGMVEAKVHVLDVKESFRGYDLGGLLFSEAMLALKRRFLDVARQKTGSEKPPCVRCLLDAEEDIRRHNKLIGFYERLGCRVKPKTQPQFLNNNDGETYRKVPMQIDLNPRDSHAPSLVDHSDGFLPVLLLDCRSKPGRITSGRDPRKKHQLDWLMVEDGQGWVKLRSTQGYYLTLDSQGVCTENDKSGDDQLAEFQLLRVSDSSQNVVSGDDEESSEDATSATEKELWMLRSRHGTFLALDATNREFYGSMTPTFWQANSGDFSLTCTPDTPIRRQHYRKMYMKQTVQYVLSCRNKYLSFQLGKKSMKDALDLLKGFRGFPFRLEPKARRVSLRTLCFRTAEAARAAGHPDWIQFLALFHGLAGAINCFDTTTAIVSEDDYDWTIPCRSRVVGCAVPAGAIFSEFADLNGDTYDERYNSAPGMYSAHCGLQNVLLTWSGPEYLFHLLKYNNVDLPDEAFSVLRLFPLYDWHSKNMYERLDDKNDEEIISFVVDFDRLRRKARKDSLNGPELSDEECNNLWESYYAEVASKFGADETLDW